MSFPLVRVDVPDVSCASICRTNVSRAILSLASGAREARDRSGPSRMSSRDRGGRERKGGREDETTIPHWTTVVFCRKSKNRKKEKKRGRRGERRAGLSEPWRGTRENQVIKADDDDDDDDDDGDDGDDDAAAALRGVFFSACSKAERERGGGDELDRRSNTIICRDAGGEGKAFELEGGTGNT